MGIPLAVATGSARSAYELKVSRYPQLAACFSHVVCADDPELKNGKPAPDVYLLAASRFSSPPQSPDKVLGRRGKRLCVQYWLNPIRK